MYFTLLSYEILHLQNNSSMSSVDWRYEVSIFRFDVVEEEKFPFVRKLILAWEHYNFDRGRRKKSVCPASLWRTRANYERKEKAFALHYVEAIRIMSRSTQDLLLMIFSRSLNYRLTILCISHTTHISVYHSITNSTEWNAENSVLHMQL